MRNYLFLDDNNTASGSFFGRIFISLVSGAFLGFLFSFLIIYNGNVIDLNEDLATSNFQMKNLNEISIQGDALADYLFHEVKILCIVMTEPLAIEPRTQYINQTWGKRCNKLIHISTEEGE
jgi:hypothetical protein